MNGNLRAEIEATVPEKVNGVLFAMGGYGGGVSLYALDGELYYEYSALLLKRDKIKVGALPAGDVTIAYEMRHAGRPGHAGRGQVLDQRQGDYERHAAAQVPGGFTSSEGFDVGMDTLRPSRTTTTTRRPSDSKGP